MNDIFIAFGIFKKAKKLKEISKKVLTNKVLFDIIIKHVARAMCAEP